MSLFEHVPSEKLFVKWAWSVW